MVSGLIVAWNVAGRSDECHCCRTKPPVGSARRRDLDIGLAPGDRIAALDPDPVAMMPIEVAAGERAVSAAMREAGGGLKLAWRGQIVGGGQGRGCHFDPVRGVPGGGAGRQRLQRRDPPLRRQPGDRGAAPHPVAGRHGLRNVLYMAALTAIRRNPPVRDLYLRLRARGRPAKAAIVAAIRKLLTILNAILRDGKPWQTA